MRPRKLFLLLALLALLTACRDAAVSPRDASSETHPAVDLVIHNARILYGESASAVVTSGGN